MRTRWLHPVLAVVVMLTLASACVSGEGKPPELKSAPARVQPAEPSVPISLCNDGSVQPGVGSSPAVAAFDVGQKVETSLRDGASLPRDNIRLSDTFTRALIDERTTLPHFIALQQRLLDTPAWARATTNDISAYASRPCVRARGEVLAGVLDELDARNVMPADGPLLRRQSAYDLDALLDPQQPLTKAVSDVFASKATAWAFPPQFAPLVDQEPSVRALADRLDLPTQQALARVIVGMAKAEEWRLAAAAPMFPLGLDIPTLATIVTSFNLSPAQARSFGYAQMARAGITLARAVEGLSAHLSAHPLPEGIDTTITTRLGEIVVRSGIVDNQYAMTSPALVVDQGGNDTYEGVIAASSRMSVPLSALVDIGGDDRYLSPDADGTQGRGMLSFGFLVDGGGNDVYQAQDGAQGSAFLGVGALLDVAGNDTYQARYYSQGAGQHGLAAAVDLGGDDSYTLTSYGQGFGYVRSAGALVDVAGNDRYVAEDTNIINASPQQADHNTSMAQGFGFGARSENSLDNLSGGTGLLVDLAGDDNYSCGVFCQGAGYLFGHGILHDVGGNDRYAGVQYLQGSGAHFAMGTLMDDAGDDSYQALKAVSQGAGHDGSAGYLLEGGGNDQYSVTSLSHGVSNDLGFGFALDAGGDDIYGIGAIEADGARFGQTKIASDFSMTGRTEGSTALGAFFDLAGADQYRSAPVVVTNGSVWRLPAQAENPPPQHIGYGEDV